MDSRTRHNALKFEILREQAAALGSAGKQLESALDQYQQHVSRGGGDDEPRTEELRNEVTQRVYALLLQREFVGFFQENIEWLRHAFDLPSDVLARVGSIPAPKNVPDTK